MSISCLKLKKKERKKIIWGDKKKNTLLISLYSHFILQTKIARLGD